MALLLFYVIRINGSVVLKGEVKQKTWGGLGWPAVVKFDTSVIGRCNFWSRNRWK